MLKFDFTTYMDSFINKGEYSQLLGRKDSIYSSFINNKMTEWFTKEINSDVVNKIGDVAEQIKNNSDVLLVIGIGGSYIGGFSITQLFNNKYKKKKTEVIYIGNNLSGESLDEVMDYIDNKDISISVVSKSGSTFEIEKTYNLVKEIMLDKYSLDEFQKRVIVITNDKTGYLKEEIDKYGFTSFVIPDGVGGRFSICTPAHLLPMTVCGVDISEFIEGYYSGKKYLNDAYNYSIIRNLMFKQGKYVENFSVYEPKLYYYTEFIKQEFAESEGKDGKGILPISTVNTRDLHSMGQFLQDGNKIIFETVLKIDIGKNQEFKRYNDLVCNSVIKAHYQGNVPNLIIDIGKLSEKSIGEATMFFMMTAVFSAYLFDVDPFSQSGVEEYKKNMNKEIKES